jgi:putative endonuclease
MTITRPSKPEPSERATAVGRTPPKPAKDQRRRDLGARGEAVAADWLRQQGLEILDQNWRGPAGEIDLVARDGATLVVVEVKTRSGTGFGAATAAVTASKYARLRRLAAQWIEQHQLHPDDIRIDVIGILLRPGRAAEVDHIAGAYR